MPWHRAAAAMAYAYLFKYIIIGDTGEGPGLGQTGVGGLRAWAEGQTVSGRGAGADAARRLPPGRAAPFPQCWSW